ncbi:MAG TPA: serine protease [Candidatus Acidoferrum sp.]|nr:serine protease [Candidatus Acidoferrum sp.]
MTFDPLAAVGLVLLRATDGREAIGGTCFLFRQDHVALTAAHCLPEEAATIRMPFPRSSDGPRLVERVERHPQADLAAAFMETPPNDSGEGYPERAFWHEVANWGLGEEFFAYGFPVEGPNPDIVGQAPVPRLFVGQYQRFFDYSSHAGYTYLAGEMSIPAPTGISGGPLFRAGAPQMVTGIATANVESYAVTDSLEEVDAGGNVSRIESRRVISYGLALMLSAVSGWLDEVIPDRPGTAYAPRPT